MNAEGVYAYLGRVKKRASQAAAPTPESSPTMTADSLINVAAGFGGASDKRSYTYYGGVYRLDPQYLERIYRTSWIAGKIIDVPAEDMMRDWVTMSWDDRDNHEDQQRALNDAEDELDMRGAVTDGIRWASLYGGAATVMIVAGENPESPLVLENIRPGSLKTLLTLEPFQEITPNSQIDQDINSPNFRYPLSYRMVGSGQSVHWSRVVVWRGRKVPRRTWLENGMWDDSVLQRVLDAITNYETATSAGTSLLFDANVDIVSVKGLAIALSQKNASEAAKIINRFQQAATMKSAVKLWLLDSDTESWQQKVTQFSGIRDILLELKQDVCGASNIPATKLFGQSPSGMNATGVSDMKDYESRLTSEQNSKVRRNLLRLKQVTAMSCLGEVPENFEMKFNPLSQPSQTEVDTSNKAFADMGKTLIDSKVVTPGLVARELRQRGTFGTMDDEDVEEAEELSAPEEPGEPMDPGADPSESDAEGVPSSEPPIGAPMSEIKTAASEGPQRAADSARKGDRYEHDGAGWRVYRDGRQIGGPYKTIAKARRRLKFEGKGQRKIT